MAKNTGNTQFRKLNVSPYSDESDGEDQAVEGGAEGPNENEVNSLMTQYPCCS